MTQPETGVLIIDQYDELGIIAANVVVGLLFVAMYPWLIPALMDQNPSGRGNAVTFGFYLAFVLVPIVFFGLAYAGIRDR